MATLVVKAPIFSSSLISYTMLLNTPHTPQQSTPPTPLNSQHPNTPNTPQQSTPPTPLNSQHPNTITPSFYSRKYQLSSQDLFSQELLPLNERNIFHFCTLILISKDNRIDFIYYYHESNFTASLNHIKN